MPLTKDQLNTLREKLLEQQKKLRDVLVSLEKSDPANDPERSNDNADTGTDAIESGELVRHESLEQETENLLIRTESALAAMENGSYGLTQDGQEIPFERLMVDPTVTTTI